MSENQPATAHVDRLLDAFHAGMLPAAEVERVERHLRECAACREQSAQVGIYQIIRAAPAPTVGPELRQRVYARIAATSAPSSATARPSRRSALDDSRHTRDVRFASGAPQPRSRLGWLGGAVAVVIVALIASVIWALPHGTRGTGTGKHSQIAIQSQGCPASATSATLPKQSFAINGLAMTSATEGWAVGAINNDQGYPTQGLIMRFSQCHWAPISASLSSIALYDVAMDSPTNGWAVGYSSATYTIALVHYSGGIWRMAASPAVQTPHPDLMRVWMRSANEGWLVTYGDGFTPTPHSTILHYRDGAWTVFSTPVQFVYNVSIAGPDDAWFSGEDAPFDAVSAHTGRFAHYDHGQWTTMVSPAGGLFDILHVVSPTDIWASGVTVPVANQAIVAHYDGATWKVVPGAAPITPRSANPSFGRVYITGDGSGWFYYQGNPSGATTASPTAKWENPAPVASVARETNGHWQTLPWPYTDINTLCAWTSLPDDEIWVIGDTTTQQTVAAGDVTLVTPNATDAVLLHYVNGKWTRYGG